MRTITIGLAIAAQMFTAAAFAADATTLEANKKAVFSAQTRKIRL